MRLRYPSRSEPITPSHLAYSSTRGQSDEASLPRLDSSLLPSSPRTSCRSSAELSLVCWPGTCSEELSAMLRSVTGDGYPVRGCTTRRATHGCQRVTPLGRHPLRRRAHLLAQRREFRDRPGATVATGRALRPVASVVDTIITLSM